MRWWDRDPTIGMATPHGTSWGPTAASDTRSFSGTTRHGPTTTTSWPGSGACPIATTISSTPTKALAVFRRRKDERQFQRGTDCQSVLPCLTSRTQAAGRVRRPPVGSVARSGDLATARFPARGGFFRLGPSLAPPESRNVV